MLSRIFFLLLSLCIFACNEDVVSSSAGASGGAGGATASSTGSGGSASSLATTGISSTSTSDEVLPCGVPEPLGCIYPEPLKGYYPGAQQRGAFLPAPGEETDGGSASCMRPLAPGVVITRAVVGFAAEPPTELALDVWTQDGEDPGERVMVPQLATLESVESGPDLLTSGVYVLGAPVSGDGLVPCIGLRVVDYLPPTMIPSDTCYRPNITWWYGLPETGNPSSPLTWAAIACPEDDSILSYRREFPYELRP